MDATQNKRFVHQNVDHRIIVLYPPTQVHFILNSTVILQYNYLYIMIEQPALLCSITSNLRSPTVSFN